MYLMGDLLTVCLRQFIILEKVYVQTSFPDLKKVWKIHVKIKSGNTYGKNKVGVFVYITCFIFILSWCHFTTLVLQ